MGDASKEVHTASVACAPSLYFSSKYMIHIYMDSLTLEGEAGADLVGGLVELVGVERKTNAEGGAGVELGVVGKGSNTAVVDLGL